MCLARVLSNGPVGTGRGSWKRDNVGGGGDGDGGGSGGARLIETPYPHPLLLVSSRRSQ